MSTIDHFPGCHDECVPHRVTDDLRQASADYRDAQRRLDNARERLRVSVVGAVKAGMSQSEVARIVGVDRLTIRKWIA